MKLTRLSWVARVQTVRTSFMQSFQIYCLPQRQQCVSQQKDTSWKCHMQLKEDGAAQALNNSDNRAWSGNWLHILQRCTFAFTDLILFVCLFAFCFDRMLLAGINLEQHHTWVILHIHSAIFYFYIDIFTIIFIVQMMPEADWSPYYPL